jgi:superfamily I DNA/RNA helicase
MKTLKRASLAVLLMPLALAVPAAAQTTGNAKDANTNAYIELLKGDVEGRRDAIVTEILQLSPEDGTSFWPIYREYDKERRALNAAGAEAVQAYARDFQQLTNARADELLNKSFQLERQRVDLKAKYYERMKAALSATTAARFFEVDRQLQAIGDLQAYSVLPANP